MSESKEQKKKESLNTLHQRILEIRKRRPSDEKITELNKVLNGEGPKTKKQIARTPEPEVEG